MNKINLCNPIIRYAGNPIITAKDVNQVWTDPKLQVITVHNAGITEYNNEVIMLFRSHLRNGISVLGIARSKNGLEDWKIDKKPAMIACTKNDNFAKGTNIDELIENEQGGIEDPRISKIGDLYYITYSAYHASIAHRVRVSLATTKDFKTFTRFGPLLKTDMRNVVIFPEKINNKYYGSIGCYVYERFLIASVDMAKTAAKITNNQVDKKIILKDNN